MRADTDAVAAGRWFAVSCRTGVWVSRENSGLTEEVAMFHTIVLALDGSEGADRAIPAAAALAASDNARLIVAHAQTRALETVTNARLAQQIDELRKAGIHAEVRTTRSVLVGREADAIAQIAHDCEADLIVIAGRGRSPFVGAVLGSVTHRLLHVCDLPVLVIPPSDVGMQEREPGEDTAAAVN